MEQKIKEWLTKSQRLLNILEYNIGNPPNMSYISVGYLGDDENHKNVCEIDNNLSRMMAITHHYLKHPIKDNCDYFGEIMCLMDCYECPYDSLAGSSKDEDPR